MSKPESIKVDPWTDFPRQSYSLFTDDFVHDKLLTWKVGSKGLNSTFNFKANVKADKAGYKVADELKFWFSLPEGRSLFAKTKSADYLKLQFDNGIITKWNKKWNLYATVNTNKALANPSLRLGVGHDSEHCHSNNRLRVDFNENDTNLTFYNRTLVRHNKCTFGNMIAYNITNKVLAKTNLLFGYKINNKVDTFVRVENANWRKYAFSLSEILQHLDLYRVDVVAQHDANIKYGVEASFRQKDKFAFDEALLVVEHKDLIKNRQTKVRVSSNFDVSLSYQYPCFIFKNIATVTLGAHGSNIHNEKRSFKGGAQLDFNV